jgi:FKBP-type peptidyl-prolyl cis-trans isomerase
MKWKNIGSWILPVLLLAACTAESLKEQLIRQEQSIETYIERQIQRDTLKVDNVFNNGGVYRLVYVSGLGKEAASGDSIIFHYKASIFDTKIYYDSTSVNPEKGILGAGQYMRGLEKGLEGMRANEQAEILLTSAQAYGDMSMGILPPNTPVKFKVIMENVVSNK